MRKQEVPEMPKDQGYHTYTPAAAQSKRVHVMRTPEDPNHWSVGTAWIAPFDLAADCPVCGLQRDKDRLSWYVDGALARWIENTHWHQPLTLNFDSETMPEWSGLPRGSDLPSTYSIE